MSGRRDPRDRGLSWLGGERLAIGRLPTASSLAELPAHGVTHVVNCRATLQVWFSQDLAAERALFGRARVAHAPLLDLGRRQPPRLWAEAARFAAQILAADSGAGVLVHCKAGRRRSAMVAYAVLRLRGHGPDDAAALITRYRTEAELVPAYLASVESWLRGPARSGGN
jgi:protein-tyrosine phosphatase